MEMNPDRIRDSRSVRGIDEAGLFERDEIRHAGVRGVEGNRGREACLAPARGAVRLRRGIALQADRAQVAVTPGATEAGGVDVEPQRPLAGVGDEVPIQAHRVVPRRIGIGRDDDHRRYAEALSVLVVGAEQAARLLVHVVIAARQHVTDHVAAPITGARVGQRRRTTRVIPQAGRVLRAIGVDAVRVHVDARRLAGRLPGHQRRNAGAVVDRTLGFEVAVGDQIAARTVLQDADVVDDRGASRERREAGDEVVLVVVAAVGQHPEGDTDPPHARAAQRVE